MSGARIHQATILALMLLAGSNVAAAPAAPAASSGPRGWSNGDALNLAKEGIEAKKAGDLPLCVQKDQASLALEDHPYVKLHVSSCFAGLGRIKDALVAARDALAAAIRNEDDDLKRAALARTQELLAKLGRIKFEMPEETTNLKITLNGIPLRPNQIKDKLTVDPGEYNVEAVREEKGERFVFKEKITIGDGEEKTVEILPKKDLLPKDVEVCLRSAKTYKDRLKCIEEPTSAPNVHVGLDLSGYTDTTNVHVFTPSINGSVISPTGGWNVGGSYLVDIISAASPDLVSSASAPFREQRHAGSLYGGYKFPTVQVAANGNVSSEPDYLSRTLGGALSTELNEKLVVPRLAYNYRWDTIGYRNTPFSQFSRALVTHSFEAGVTLVLAPTTVLVTGLSLDVERGENAKLYRFIPMFTADDAKLVSPGLNTSRVNQARLAVRARELVPAKRDRLAIGARLAHRFPNGTLRVEERIYRDNWSVTASTTDARYIHDLGERFRVWPHLRFHAQSGASFYQLAYSATLNEAGVPIEIPRYRTADRELSPMIGLTGGGGARFALNGPSSSPQYALVASGDIMFNYYFRSLYITTRTAFFGTVGFEADF